MNKNNNTYQGRNDILKIMSGEWLARACYVAVKLEIAEILDSGLKTIQELALLTRNHEESLYRLLRVLTCTGIFIENDNRTFCHNAVSALLSSKHPDTLKHLVLFYAEIVPQAWDHLLPSVTTGVPAFQIATNMSQFEWGKAHPEKGDIFQKAMKEKSKAVAQSCLEVYDFSPFKTMCDLGGGYGHFMMALLSKYPHMHGIVFELPEVIQAIIAQQGSKLNERCELVAGDFFKQVPEHVDAFLMKSVLHDWNDADSIAILKNCHRVLPHAGRVFLIEVVLADKQHSFPYCMDLLMMAVTGGKERTLQEWHNLLFQGGFELVKIIPTETEFSVIEAKKLTGWKG